MVAASIQVDSNLLGSLHQQILFAERQTTEQPRSHEPVAVQLLRTIPGIGKTLALTILYEVGDIGRSPSVGTFIPYARLVKRVHESACLSLRESEEARAWHQRLVSKYGKAKALWIMPESTQGPEARPDRLHDLEEEDTL